jgi:hypothetical protein
VSVPQPLVEAILNGRFDGQLDQLTNLIQRRKELVGQQLLLALNAGDRVRFNLRTRPKYLRGVGGTVHHVEGDKAFITLSRSVGRYREGSVIGTPAVLLERVP